MLPNFSLMVKNIICLDKHIQWQQHSLCSHSRISHPTLPTNQTAVKGIMQSHTLRSHSRNFPKEANTTVRVNYVDAQLCNHGQFTQEYAGAHTHSMYTLPWTNPNSNLPPSVSLCTHTHTHTHTQTHTHTLSSDVAKFLVVQHCSVWTKGVI